MSLTIPPTVCGAALTVLVLAPACGGTPPRTESAASPLAVTTSVVREVATFERLEAGGLVAARESATLSSRVMAPVREVRVRAGDRVRAGQILVVLDAAELVAQASQASFAASGADQGLAAAKTELASASAAHKLAAAWQARMAVLHAKNSATQQELDEANARLTSASARLEGAGMRVAQAEAGAAASHAGATVAATVRGFATVAAPFDGLVTETMVDPGNLVSPGVPLLRVDAEGGRRVEVAVDEHRIGYVSLGDAVDVLMAGSDSGSSTAVQGEVKEIARAVSPGSRAFTVKIDLPPSVTAKTGTFARVRLRGAARSALVVSPSAIVRQGQVTSVYVVENDLARLRLVHAGATLADGLEILAGVEAGERVIDPPPPSLADGRPVKAVASSGDGR